MGTFVVRRPAGSPPDTQLRLTRRVQAWVQDARAAGLDDEGLESIMRAAVSAGRAEEIA